MKNQIRKIVIILILLNVFLLYSQDTTIDWIKTSDLSKLPSIVTNDMTSDLIIAYNTLGESEKINNNYISDELNYYLNGTNYSIYDETNDFVTIKNIYFYGDGLCNFSTGAIKARRSVWWWPYYEDYETDTMIGFEHRNYINFDTNKSSTNKSFVSNIQRTLACCSTNKYYGLVEWYQYINIDINNSSTDPMIQKKIFLRSPDVLDDSNRFFTKSSYDNFYKDWGYNGKQMVQIDTNGESYRWPQMSEDYINLFLAKSPLPKIDHPTKYFSNDIDNPIYHNFLWTDQIDITTDYRVKIFVLHCYIIIDGKTLTSKFPLTYSNGDIVEETRNGIDSISIPQYHITEEGRYAMELGIVDKFNKMYLFEPQYFTIVKPEVAVSNYEMSNNGSEYHPVTDDLTSDGVNTNNKSMKLRLTADVTNLYDTNLSIGFSPALPLDIGSELYDDANNSQRFYLMPTIEGIETGTKVFDSDVVVGYANTGVTAPIQPLTIRYVQDIEGATSGVIVPKTLELSQTAKDNEQRLWQDDEYRTNVSPICENDESLKGTDFLIQNAELFDIPIELTNKVNLINLTVTQNNITKNFYFKISTDQSTVTCYDDNGNQLSDYTINRNASGNITTIHKKIYYDQFFSGANFAENAFPVNVFAKQFKVNAEAIKFFTHNYYESNLILTDEDIDSKILSGMGSDKIKSIFANRKLQEPVDEKGISTGQSAPDEKSPKSPPFPSRVVYTDIRRDVLDDDTINFHIKPKFTNEITPDSSYSYRIVALKDTYLSGLNENDILDILHDVNGTSVMPESNAWTYDVVKGCYISDWISNSSSEPLTLGKDDYDTSNKFKFIEGTTSNSDAKIHFYTLLRFEDTDGTFKYTSSYRHSAICIDDSLSVIHDPADLFDDGDDVYIHEKVIFTKDVFIPEGKSITFGYGSYVNTTKCIKVLSTVALNNNIKIISKGRLVITNKDGSKTSPKKVYFGPTGISDSMSMNSASDFLLLNGMWGGIYMLDNGLLTIDGAIITGAYDGVILYNNAGNANIKDCEIKYNEIGLHLFNSYPVVDGTLLIESNLLYGVKEDNMTNKGTWLFNGGLLDSITGNLMNYYDYEQQVIK